MSFIDDIIRKFIKNVPKKRYLSYSYQKQFLDSFSEPIDDFERSFNQYLCQCVVSRKGKLCIFVLNFLSLVMIVTIFITGLFKICKKTEKEKDTDILFFNGNDLSILPLNFKNTDVLKLPLLFSIKFTKYNLNYIYKIWKSYPLSFFFLLKNMIKILLYTSAIEKYTPKRILCSCEYSFTSSILTFYCESLAIEHVNLMHGEKIFDITDSFCRFTKFYVWDEYYIFLFKKLRAGISNFIVQQCPAICLDLNAYHLAPDEYYDYTFYLAIENDKTLYNLRGVINTLQQAKKRIILRPHPLYTDIMLLHKYFDAHEIEETSEITITFSVARTRNLVSVVSTVLFQAYQAKKNIIIDDVSNPQYFTATKENLYIMHTKPHLLLSELLSTRLM